MVDPAGAIIIIFRQGMRNEKTGKIFTVPRGKTGVHENAGTPDNFRMVCHARFQDLRFGPDRNITGE